QIRRAGRWNPDQMVGCYLDAFPRKFMRSIAGHPAQMGCFNLLQVVPPPPALLSMIWPELDQWVDSAQKPKDLAGTGTVHLLVYLREVVLQDSAFLIDRYPGSSVWSHTVYRVKSGPSCPHNRLISPPILGDDLLWRGRHYI
ncbi:hypothetical protein C8A05DRAFT_20357, partial [Staphylotrichum tortipilum]